MGILNQLSSQTHDRTETSNRRVAAACLDDPDLLQEIAAGLESPSPALAGDCAEVMTMVAEADPGWVASYAARLAPLIDHPHTRARWEAMHALALLAQECPDLLSGLLPTLRAVILQDASVIVRDHAVQAVGNYAQTGAQAAGEAFPILLEALEAWDGKQAGHALRGLAKAVMADPAKKPEGLACGQAYANHPRGVVRQAARDLIKACR